MSAEWFRNELDKKIGVLNDSHSVRIVPDGRVSINHVSYTFVHLNSTQWNKTMQYADKCQIFLDQKDHVCTFFLLIVE